jgi:hypothetical protein
MQNRRASDASINAWFSYTPVSYQPVGYAAAYREKIARIERS